MSLVIIVILKLKQDDYSSPRCWIYIFKNSKNSNYDLVVEEIEFWLASQWTQVQIPLQRLRLRSQTASYLSKLQHNSTSFITAHPIFCNVWLTSLTSSSPQLEWHSNCTILSHFFNRWARYGIWHPVQPFSSYLACLQASGKAVLLHSPWHSLLWSRVKPWVHLIVSSVLNWLITLIINPFIGYLDLLWHPGQHFNLLDWPYILTFYWCISLFIYKLYVLSFFPSFIAE